MTWDHHDPDLAVIRIEYVLGTLDGRQRALFVDHLATCTECATEITALADSVDALTLGAPDAEPPVGFESRVLTEISAATPLRRVRSRTLLFSLAAAVIVVVASTSLLAAWPRSSRTYSTTVVERPLWFRHHQIGTVYAQLGPSRWMVIVSSQHTAVRRVDCVVVTDTNRTLNLGSFAYGTGSSSWPAELPVAARHVRQIRLVSFTGAVIATSGVSPWGTWAAS
jgi:anti-sigma factor RsiW